MRHSSRVLAVAVVLMIVAGAGARAAATGAVPADPLPWAAAGWTERQAAAHLLDRFAFGPRPGDVDRALAQGLEAWLEAQLEASLTDARYQRAVEPLEAWRMPASDIARTFPPYVVLRREAARAGVVDRPGTAPPDPGAPTGGDDAAERRRAADQRRALLAFARSRGYRLAGELTGELMAHKLLQAVYSENQLQAVLVDFWFNHFNVSLTDNRARLHLLSFERDAIAPGVLGKFGDLLAEVAAHPAMLLYLDNAQSTAEPGTRTTLDSRVTKAGFAGPRRRGMRGGGDFGEMRSPAGGARNGQPSPASVERRARPRGLNENYARELLELHTLGVEGGYTQEDVIAVARAFTGWTVLPPGGFGDQARSRMRRSGASERFGFVEGEGGFFFRADAHDAEAKTVLGRKLPPGRGIEDGVDVLGLVAGHPSTARHLATKIAARFVADEPPPALVDRLAQTFLASGGDLRAVIRALAYSPEFWSRDARAAKIKSPFEVAVSAVRALDAEVSVPPPQVMARSPESRRGSRPGGLVDWIGRMGQPLYAYQAPTGFPDRAEAWVSTGSLLTRMNFGLHLATGRVPGVALDLAALNGEREPESPEHALATYAALLLPERDLEATVRRLAPMVRDPELAGRLERAATDVVNTAPSAASRESVMGDTDEDEDEMAFEEESLDAKAEVEPVRESSPRAIENVVGLILGSPEFQRR